jgi:hypothetical protein
VFTNVKLATPVFDEFLKAATKYHAILEHSNAAATDFIEALGKV